MASQVIVFDHGMPRMRLLAWFLADSGIETIRAMTLQEVREALRASPHVLVCNCGLPTRECAGLVERIRAIDPGRLLRIVVFNPGRHRPTDAPVSADVCCHDVRDIDVAVQVTRAVLDDAER